MMDLRELLRKIRLGTDARKELAPELQLFDKELGRVQRQHEENRRRIERLHAEVEMILNTKGRSGGILK